MPPVRSNKVYLYDIPDKDTKPETGFKARGNQELLNAVELFAPISQLGTLLQAKMNCQLKDERKGAHQTVSLSCLAVEWPDAVYL